MKSMKDIEEAIDNLFIDADGVHDTIWFSGTETLYEAICAVVEDAIKARDQEQNKLLQSIINADRTPEYGYGADAKNNAGKSPPVGARWMSPREQCKEALKDLERSDE